MLDVAPLEALRRQRPLIHCVSNLVTANDCANLALAVGASPMMACAPQEMAEITAAASATVLNTGTPDKERFEVCRLVGHVLCFRHNAFKDRAPDNKAVAARSAFLFG